MRVFPRTRLSRRNVIASIPMASLVAVGWQPFDALGRQATPAASHPVEIEHLFGVTEVIREPARVMTIGYSEQDLVLALGVAPVTVREWFGGKPVVVSPWGRVPSGTPSLPCWRCPTASWTTSGYSNWPPT